MRSIRGDAATGSSAADAELLATARSGSLQAREALYRRHVNLVHGLCFRLAGRLANHRELVDPIFLRAFASLHRLPHPEALRPWLTGLTVQAVRRAIRRKHLLARIGLPVNESPHFDAALEDAAPDVADELRRLYARVERLPLNLRMAFLLRRVEDMSLGDCALALDASPAQVRRWVARAEARMGVAPRAAAAARASA
jgi:RNA polymerase sigma-70 factor (ECF subfamily)